MVTFKSDLTNQDMSVAQLRQFDVPDESGEIEEDTDPIAALNARMISRGLPPLSEDLVKQMRQQQSAAQPVAVPKKTNEFKELAELEKAAKDARIAKNTGRSKLSAAAKHRIEILCGMSRLTTEVKIEENTFVLRNLKSKELQEAISKAAEYDGTVDSTFEIRNQLLSRSLYQVADMEVGLFLGDDSVEARLEFLSELDEPVVSVLYDEYVKLANLTKNKYAIKTEKEAAEVAEDLKK